MTVTKQITFTEINRAEFVRQENGFGFYFKALFKIEGSDKWHYIFQKLEENPVTRGFSIDDTEVTKQKEEYLNFLVQRHPDWVQEYKNGQVLVPYPLES